MIGKIKFSTQTPTPLAEYYLNENRVKKQVAKVF